MAFSNHGVWFKLFLAKYICINDPSNISARVTEYPPAKIEWYSRILSKRYSPIFKVYVHSDKFSFQN